MRSVAKRILLCIPNHSSYKKGIVSALLRMGATVELFDFRKGATAARVTGLIKNKLNFQSSLINSYISNSIQNRLLAKVSKFNPRIVLVIKGHEINPETIVAITKKGITTINWYPDWLVLWPWIKMNAPSYAYFLSSCRKLNHKAQKSVGRLHICSKLSCTRFKTQSRGKLLPCFNFLLTTDDL